MLPVWNTIAFANMRVAAMMRRVSSVGLAGRVALLEIAAITKMCAAPHRSSRQVGGPRGGQKSNRRALQMVGGARGSQRCQVCKGWAQPTATHRRYSNRLKDRVLSSKPCTIEYSTVPRHEQFIYASIPPTWSQSHVPSFPIERCGLRQLDPVPLRPQAVSSSSPH